MPTAGGDLDGRPAEIDGAPGGGELVVPDHGNSERLGDFVDRADRLPVDSHTAKALIAPRGLLNTQGADDDLANPAGTKESFAAAQKIFDLLGVPNHQAIHWRPGGHGQLREDWLALFDFSERFFSGR